MKAQMSFRVDRPRLASIIHRAARISGESVPTLTGPTRCRHICRIRYAVMAAARAHDYSVVRIGRALGGRDHTTVLNGLKRAEQFRADAGFSSFVTELSQ